MKEPMINKTENYDKFQYFLFNRSLNEGLVKRIMDSIQEIGWMHSNPILVDKTLTVIDGQHRFEACRRLGLPIYYVITDVDPQTAIMRLNANQSSWKTADYINSYAESGVRCYIALRDFESKHGFGMTNSTYICFGISDVKQTEKIKAGHKFHVNPKAEEIAEFIKSCNVVPYYKSSYFVKAVVKVFNMLNNKQIQKIQANIMSLPQQATSADYVAAFENILNRKMRKQNHISLKASQ